MVGLLATAVSFPGSRASPCPSREVEITLANGMKMFAPRNMSSYRRLSAGMYEAEVTAVLRSLLGTGMTMVDLGANVGYYTLIASTLVGATGHVYSFEPDPRVFPFLRRNIGANDAKNTTAECKAVSSKGSTVTFVPNGWEGSFVTYSAGSQPYPLVEAVSLDEFFRLRGWPRVDLVKLDIEGSEYEALQGMSELSGRNPRLRLVMEFNLAAIRRAGVEPVSLAKVLKELGFRSAYVIECGLRAVSIQNSLPISHLIYNLLLTKELLD
jgi:FkbM family methyltransferase